MASEDPHKHCLTCPPTTGHTPGETTTLGDLPCFVVHPAAGPSANCILVVTDVFGYTQEHVRKNAAMFAQHGLSCYIPDVLCGDAIDHNAFDRSKFVEWKARHGDDVTLPLCEAAATSLRARHAKVYTQGYCFGARYSILLAGSGKVDAFAIAHPSFVTTADLVAATTPGIFLLAEVDTSFPESAVKEAREALEAKWGEAAEKRFVWKGPYPHTVHGFAARGDESDVKVWAARLDALNSAASFLKAL